MKTQFIAPVVVALLLGALPAMAQNSAVAEGELLSVDVPAKIISVRTTSDAPDGQTLFRYSDETRIVGADGEAAGLAATAGTRVAIKYIQRGHDKVATEILVRTRLEQHQQERGSTMTPRVRTRGAR